MLQCAAPDLQIDLLNGFKYGQFCLNALFSVLKHKVTVGKDTLNIKKAVCCSEVGPVGGMAKL